MMDSFCSGVVQPKKHSYRLINQLTYHKRRGGSGCRRRTGDLEAVVTVLGRRGIRVVRQQIRMTRLVPIRNQIPIRRAQIGRAQVGRDQIARGNVVGIPLELWLARFKLGQDLSVTAARVAARAHHRRLVTVPAVHGLDLVELGEALEPLLGLE